MKLCPLCQSGFPLDGVNHIPTQRLGMIPVMRCRNHIKRGDVLRFRNYLNYLHTGQKHHNGRHRQRQRQYGDYLYHQDRDKFMADMCEWLPKAGLPNAGFSLIELLAVCVIIAALASLILPVLSKARLKAQSIQCLSNQRNLFLAWQGWITDNQDRIPLSYNASWTTEEYHANLEYTWVNESLVKPWPYWETEQSILQPYLKSTGVFLCPGNKRDQKLSQLQNYYIGGVGIPDPHKYTKLCQVEPGIFIFTDAREDQSYMSRCLVYLDEPAVGFATIPAAYHNRAGSFVFADGHVEIRRWKNPETMPAIGERVISYDNQDAAWLQERAARR